MLHSEVRPPRIQSPKNWNFVSGKIVQSHLQDQSIKLKVTLERYNSKITCKCMSPITWKDATPKSFGKVRLQPPPRCWRLIHFLEISFFRTMAEQMPSVVRIVLTCSLQSPGILLTAPGAPLIDFQKWTTSGFGRKHLSALSCRRRFPSDRRRSSRRPSRRG